MENTGNTESKDNKDKKEKKDIVKRKPPVLFKKTQAIIAEIEKDLDGDFLTYWISDNGSLAQEDVIAFHKLISKTKKAKRLHLFIKSDGGSGKGALRIIHLLRNYYEEIIALVPLDCASAATMLALGADTIMMGPLAYLSAIDTSITHELSPIDEKYNDKVSVSQNELDRVLKLWEQKKQPKDSNPFGLLYDFIHPLVFGAVDRASSLSIKLTKEILSYHMKDEEKSEKISTHLNSDYPSHSYPITYKEAQVAGLNVLNMEPELNERLLTLNELYSEMAQKAHTDFDESNYHDNEIIKLIEIKGEQIFYQMEKDWYYRSDERRYIPMNDSSSWRRNTLVGAEIVTTKFHTR